VDLFRGSQAAELRARRGLRLLIFGVNKQMKIRDENTDDKGSVMSEESVALLEFEEVRQEYEAKDAIGIPMSVRERYEKALTEKRSRIRMEQKTKNAKRLGEILMEAKALDQERLQQGLAEQRLRGKKELLGEVLLSLDLIKEEALLAGLRVQASEN